MGRLAISESDSRVFGKMQRDGFELCVLEGGILPRNSR